MLFLSAVNLGTPADANPRVVLAGSGTPSLAMGPGGATAADTFIRRSAAKTLIVDADGANGQLTTVDFKTVNLLQNGSPIGGGTVTVKSASIPFTDGDTARIVTISDGSVLATSKIIGFITRPSLATLPNYTIVQTAFNHSDAGTSLVLSLGTQPVIGHTLLLAVGANTGNMSSVVTANVTWTRVVTGGVNFAREWWVGQISSGAGQTITVTLPGTGRSTGFCWELGGVYQGVPQDQTNTATGSSATMSSGSVTPTTADEIVFGMGIAFSAAALGAPSGGFTQPTGGVVASATMQMAVAYLIETTAVAASTTWSMTSGAWDGCIVSLFPAPALEDEEYIYHAGILNVQTGSFDLQLAATAMGFEEPDIAPNETIVFNYVIG